MCEGRASEIYALGPSEFIYLSWLVIMMVYGRGGVRCRQDGCNYECQPKMDKPIGKLLGLKPGDVELCTLKGCKDFPVGMTLNNAPCLHGREFAAFRNVIRALKSHYTKYHPDVRPMFLYKEKQEVCIPERIARGLLMQRARTARYRERKAWDRDFLVRRGIGIYKIKHPLDTKRNASLVPIGDINFLPWVRRLKVEPISTEMLVGDEPWVFQFQPWRTIHGSLFSRVQSTVNGAWDIISKCFSHAIMQKTEEQDGGFNDKMLRMFYECFLCQTNLIMSYEGLQENLKIPTFVVENIKQCVRAPGVGYTGDLYRVEPVQDREARCQQWMIAAEKYAHNYADEQMVRQGAMFLASVSQSSADKSPTDEKIATA